MSIFLLIALLLVQSDDTPKQRTFELPRMDYGCGMLDSKSDGSLFVSVKGNEKENLIVVARIDNPPWPEKRLFLKNALKPLETSSESGWLQIPFMVELPEAEKREHFIFQVNVAEDDSGKNEAELTYFDDLGEHTLECPRLPGSLGEISE